MFLKSVREEKQRLRARCKKMRAECPARIKQRLDKALTAQVLALDEYQSCGTLLVFVSSAIECDTHEIIRQAFADGKRVAVPKCRNKSGEMDFYYIRSFSDLEVGAFSILEPSPQNCEKAENVKDGLCLVPGLCFDLEGYRVGFGKGYYDRFLDTFAGITAGICYHKYVFRELPRGLNDRHTDILVTERFINRIVDKRCMHE